MNSPSTPGAGSSTASRTVGTRSPSVDPSLVQPGSSDLPTAPSDRPPTISASTASPSSHVAPRQPFVPPQVPRSALPSTAGPSGRPIGGQVPPLNGPPRAPEPYDPLKPGVPIDEAKMISEGVRLRVFLALAHDQLKTLHPDVSAFKDHEDVLERLLPYHLWQIPDDDLHGPLTAPSRKGKGRARDWEEETEEEERAALKEAIGFAKRRKKLEDRLRKVKQGEGTHASTSDMTICLNRTIADDELPQLTRLRSEHAQARHRYTILTSQINQIRNPSLAQPRPAPSTSSHAASAASTSTGYYSSPQGYPGTPIYRPLPGGGGIFQPSRLPLGASTPGRPPSHPTLGRPPTSQAPGYRPPLGRPPSSLNSPAGPASLARPPDLRPTATAGATPSARQAPSSTNGAPSSSAIPEPPTASSDAAPKPAINVHVPHPLSVPIAFLPDLQAAGILSDDTTIPSTPGLATDVQVDDENVRFTVVLATLAGEKIKTLSDVLSRAHGKP